MANIDLSSLPPGFYPSYETCDQISQICPVKATTLGYSPNLGVNIFVAIGFGLFGLITLATGLWKKTWGFSIAVAAGCILECVGYIGRVLLSENAWNGDAFKMQIVAIVLGPTLVCIGLYLTLRHIVISLNAELSRIAPRLYPVFFVPADISCLVIQAIGGGVAAAAGRDNYNILKHGNRIIMAGIVLQVIVLGAFGGLAGDYLVRVTKAFNQSPGMEGSALWKDRKFRVFLWAMGGAYAALMIRCIYRIAEMAGGWANHIMQHESSFVVLESFMVLIACGLLACAAPGFLFPEMSHNQRIKDLGKGRQQGGVDVEMAGAGEKATGPSTSPSDTERGPGTGEVAFEN
ncbi:RTA1 like protein-domain-containing protein [Triangularia setosa]|uniref:RTA1 like protein-domain-containing protein n=1 Tax=Triangularia setosa TaxID=2587417 RepID=A0AAN6W269_9PEZI|nr:RTA1 like protein-domain-containing protein [Podospora setosa]